MSLPMTIQSASALTLKGFDLAADLYRTHQEHKIRLAEIEAMQDLAKEQIKLKSEENQYLYQIECNKYELKREYIKGFSSCAEKMIEKEQFERAERIAELMAKVASSSELLPREVFRDLDSNTNKYLKAFSQD